jgi:hypothetical protein
MENAAGQSLSERVRAIDADQSEMRGKLKTQEEALNKWLEDMCEAGIALNTRLSSRHAGSPAKAEVLQSADAVSAKTEEQPGKADYQASIEKLLQGSIDALGDKLSERIVGMLRELKTMAGPMREAKISEIWNAAQSEHVDLAGLFLHEKVESNLGADGLKVEETKGKGIGSILDKLKKMKGK